jgi:UDP-3-O-[3-hydroxymyristoyl] glucosamine N-acyltransferase
MIGGQVGIAGHLTIGDNVRIQAQSVGRNIKTMKFYKEVLLLIQ